MANRPFDLSHTSSLVRELRPLWGQWWGEGAVRLPCLCRMTVSHPGLTCLHSTLLPRELHSAFPIANNNLATDQHVILIFVENRHVTEVPRHKPCGDTL